MKKQVVVIGMGRFGVSLATTLSNMGHDVLALDIDENCVQNISSEVTHAVQADSTNEAVLKELGINNFDVAIVAMGSAIESSVLSAILLKKIGIPYLIARAENELHGSILDKIGVDVVVYPEREMGTRVASSLTLTGVSDYMQVVPGYGVTKLTAPSYFVGEKLSDLGFGPKGKWAIAALLLQRKDEVIVNPSQRSTIKADDILILAGNDDDLEKLLTEAKNNKENHRNSNSK